MLEDKQMTTLRIPTPLRPYAEGAGQIEVQATTVSGAMMELTNTYPALKKHLFTEEGELRAYVNLFLNDEDIRHLEGVETKLTDGDRLMIIPSIAGGR
jgi:adenylyltransferase/sulfurtransferase